MSRHDVRACYPGFPGESADAHLQTIPACAALGMRQLATPGEPVETLLGATLPAVRDADGRVDRGAALVLADQATAGGVFASLAEPTPMMTLDLRVDWLAPLPSGVLACRVDDVAREGAVALVRARLLDGDAIVGAATARYLIGAMPGGGERIVREAVSPISNAPNFTAYLGAAATDDGLTLNPRPEHVGGPLPAFHGGVIAALLDRAGTAVAPEMRPIDIETRYLSPARADRPLIAIVRPRRIGRRAATIDVDAHQGDPDRPVAVARLLLLADPPATAREFVFPR